MINQSGQQVKKIAPKIIKGAIEQVYKMPFRLLGKFGENSYAGQLEKLREFLKDNV